MKRQENEFLKAFSYWPTPNKRTGGNIYDVRSYRVKPGSMYDWGNYWAKGINCRKNVRADIPYGGFFSQLVSFFSIKCDRYSDNRKTNKPSCSDLACLTKN